MTQRVTGVGLTLFLALQPALQSVAAPDAGLPDPAYSSTIHSATVPPVAPVASLTIPSEKAADRNDLVLRNAAVLLGGGLIVGYYGMTHWWQDGFAGQFRTSKEGWFGQGTEYGGADKLGHSYFSYVNARLMTRGFEAVGNSPAQARRLGAWSALGVMMGVEVLDGFSKKYRFSGEDAVMNLAGVGLAVAMETWPTLDRMLDYRLLYKPSPGSSFEPEGITRGRPTFWC